MKKETEKKPKPLTRDQLIAQGFEREKEIARLAGLLTFKDREDERVRREIDDLLAPPVVIEYHDNTRDMHRNSYMPSRNTVTKAEQENKVATWIEIAFKIGELKADADYSLLLEGDREKSRIVEEQKRTIYFLEHPSDHGKDCHCPECYERRHR